MYQSRPRPNKFRRTIITYILLIVLLLAFMATIGLDVLIQTTHFISSVANRQSGQINDAQDSDLVLPPQILDLPEATNEARLSLTIRAQPNRTISLYLNDKMVEEQELDEDEEDWEVQILLNEGDNNIYALSQESKSRTTAKSDEASVFYSHEEPKLIISSPNPNQRVFTNEISVSGNTDLQNSITINGKPVVIDSQGNFARTVTLVEGENKILVAASDKAGNTKTEERIITYER